MKLSAVLDLLKYASTIVSWVRETIFSRLTNTKVCQYSRGLNGSFITVNCKFKVHSTCHISLYIICTYIINISALPSAQFDYTFTGCEVFCEK